MNSYEFIEASKLLIRWVTTKVLTVLVVIMLIAYITNLLGIWKDSTDGEGRSGMSLHVDNLTGCHYLGTANGGITPRMDGRNKHVCEID